MSSLLTGYRVLVVEDEFLILLTIESALKQLGCSTIHSAATVKDGIAKTCLHRFDFAILDLNLKGDRSYPIADALAALCVPFAFSTGYTDMLPHTVYRDRPVLQKPYTHTAFLATIAELHDQSELAHIANESQNLH